MLLTDTFLLKGENTTTSEMNQIYRWNFNLRLGMYSPESHVCYVLDSSNKKIKQLIITPNIDEDELCIFIFAIIHNRISIHYSLLLLSLISLWYP